MFRPTLDDIIFIGLCLEAFFYGLYSGIFVLYIQYQISNKESNKTQNIIFYFICALYVSSVAVFVCDIIYQLVTNPSLDSVLHIDFIQSTSFALCDFIAQFILIYRCWIVWGCNIHVVIIPSILAFAFLATWLAGGYSEYILSGELVDPLWGDAVILSSLAISLTVNALVTGLIVLRIFKVFREVKATSDDQILGAAGGSKLRRVIFILIESGMALFSIQLARLVVTIVGTDTAMRAFEIICTIHEMLTGITPTIILVRTSMGLSFHDEKSMEEFAIESLRFASSHSDSLPETGSINIVDQERRDGDDIGIQESDEIEVVAR